MTKTKLNITYISALLLTISFCNINAQSIDDFLLSKDSYNVAQIDNNTYLIDEGGMATMYLLIGQNKSLLIDNGGGLGHVDQLIKDLTNLPLMVICTHGHGDHIGGSYMFNQIYMPKKDKHLFDEMFNFNNRFNSVKVYLAEHNVSIPDEMLKPYCSKAKVEYIKNGQSIDIGGRIIDIVKLPGHTTGSVMFIDRNNGYLFSGDAIIGWLLLHFDESSTSIKSYYKSLLKIRPQLNGITKIYTGHEHSEEGVPFSFIDTVIHDVESVLKGEVTGEIVDDGHGEAVRYIFDEWRVYRNLNDKSSL